MEIERDQSLRAHNTLALEAHASAFAAVSNEAELREAILWARDNSLPVMALGQGSNIVLVNDINYLVVLQQGQGIAILDEDASSVTLRVNAGNDWHELVQWSLSQGYYGLENLALIPGTVGAAPIQNIGAYGVELKTFVAAVHGLRADNAEPLTLSADECAFAYRDSVFKHQLRDQVLITAVDLRLSKTPALNLSYPALSSYLGDAKGEISAQQVYDAVVAIRRSKLPDPAVEPNVGSFFKNPVVSAERGAQLAEQFPGLPRYPAGENAVKLPAAWLIDHCNWKGTERDGVAVHPTHALVLVNRSAQSGQVVLTLAADIQASVDQQFNIALEIEPRVYGANA